MNRPAPAKEVPSAALTCTKCHGLLGKSIFPEVPNLAGQKKNYLVKQLAAFKVIAHDEGAPAEDLRYHFVMTEEDRNLSDPEIDVLSDFFSGLSCR